MAEELLSLAHNGADQCGGNAISQSPTLVMVRNHLPILVVALMPVSDPDAIMEKSAMVKKLSIFFLVITLASFSVLAADEITTEQIREVIQATDTAAENRDAQGIAVYLGEGFFKNIEVPLEDVPLVARINKAQYLELIEKGWEAVEQYSYRRQDIVINVARDGSSGESNSTIIETMRTEGEDVTSKVREYARYEMENGQPVIVNIESMTLVGDTTPE